MTVGSRATEGTQASQGRKALETSQGRQVSETSQGRLAAQRRFAIEAVITASRLTRAVRAAFDPSSQATSKSDASPVTVADLGAQTLVSLALADALPADGLMGEEDSGPLAASPELADAVLARVREHRADVSMDILRDALDRCSDLGGPGRRWWTLDPVDGTKGFLRNEQYAVALALIEDGEVVLAVMACPNLPYFGEPGMLLDGERGGLDHGAPDGGGPDHRGPDGGGLDHRGPDGGAPDGGGPVGVLFVAERGRGTRMLPLDDANPDRAGEPVRVAEPSSAAEGRYAESVEAGHSDQSASVRIGQRLGITRPPLRLDSQTKYAVVARGDASIYLRLPRGGYVENVWDHAAGYLIMREAGGSVSDVRGAPLDFTTGTRLTANSGIVATAGSIHDEVVAAVRSVLEG